MESEHPSNQKTGKGVVLANSPLLQKTPCRKGSKGFCKMQNKQHECPWVWVPRGATSRTGGQAVLGHPRPEWLRDTLLCLFLHPAGSCSSPPWAGESCRNQTLQHTRVSAYDCAVCLCYLFLMPQHLQLLQECSLTSKPARYYSGTSFDHRYLR